MSESTPSRWRGVPPEARQAERRQLLLDTAFDLLGTDGWSATTHDTCVGLRTCG